ncbi:MAG: glycosyltransferase, partial [Acetobacteraceae bacterium]|nr:glycosyltransferase [Acetobacteraceae bacterium]
MLSVIVPALNAATTLGATLASVAGDPVAETVVVDGGSTDATADLAAALGARVIRAARGRGVQIAAGVAASSGLWLLVLHADTRLGTSWRDATLRHMHACPDRAGYFAF